MLLPYVWFALRTLHIHLCATGAASSGAFWCTLDWIFLALLLLAGWPYDMPISLTPVFLATSTLGVCQVVLTSWLAWTDGWTKFGSIVKSAPVKSGLVMSGVVAVYIIAGICVEEQNMKHVTHVAPECVCD